MTEWTERHRREEVERLLAYERGYRDGEHAKRKKPPPPNADEYDRGYKAGLKSAFLR